NIIINAKNLPNLPNTKNIIINVKNKKTNNNSLNIIILGINKSGNVPKINAIEAIVIETGKLLLKIELYFLSRLFSHLIM
ncbi:hypothetical protein L7834_018540, partial [Providencia rettgeri]|uniref:hypothetical protein n=1 Tax=Providencia rettgeri TaxID=587 RepID=UPI001EE70C84